MSKGIKISEKHGVNPSLEQCFFCGEPKGIILFGRLKEDAEAPREVCLNHEPCDKCKGYMEQGVMLVSVKDGSDRKNPCRTGAIAVIKEEAVKKMFKNFSGRFAFVEDAVWDSFMLPREAKT